MVLLLSNHLGNEVLIIIFSRKKIIAIVLISLCTMFFVSFLCLNYSKGKNKYTAENYMKYLLMLDNYNSLDEYENALLDKYTPEKFRYYDNKNDFDIKSFNTGVILIDDDNFKITITKNKNTKGLEVYGSRSDGNVFFNYYITEKSSSETVINSGIQRCFTSLENMKEYLFLEYPFCRLNFKMKSDQGTTDGIDYYFSPVLYGECEGVKLPAVFHGDRSAYAFFNTKKYSVSVVKSNYSSDDFSAEELKYIFIDG